MKLQIKDAGAWRNVATFTNNELPAVMAAGSQLLRALNQPGTALRIAEGDTPIDACVPPAGTWSSKPNAPTPYQLGMLEGARLVANAGHAAAFRRSTSCNQNCNQGRCCTCRPTNLNTK